MGSQRDGHNWATKLNWYVCMLVSIIYLHVSSHFVSTYVCMWASPAAQRLKCLPGMQETRVQSLSWEDPLEKEMATHSSTLAWRIPWSEEPGRLQSMGLQRVGHDWVTSLFSFLCMYVYNICIFVAVCAYMHDFNYLATLVLVLWRPLSNISTVAQACPYWAGSVSRGLRLCSTETKQLSIIGSFSMFWYWYWTFFLLP